MKHVYQSDKAVSLYLETHYIPDDVKEKVALAILSQLDLGGNRRIFYPGVGEGSCFLIPLVKCFFMLTEHLHHSSITIVCIDNSKLMKERLEQNVLKLGELGEWAVEQNTGHDYCEYWIVEQRSKHEVRLQIIDGDVEAFGDVTEKYSSVINGHFDVIIAHFLLHHLVNWRLSVFNLLRYLKHGGFLVFSERLGDIAYVDGNFSGAGTENIRQQFLAFNAFRNKLALWTPEIRASDYGPVLMAFRLAGAETKQFVYRWKYRADFKNWCMKRAYTNLWIGLASYQSEVMEFIEKNVQVGEQEFEDGLRLVITRIDDPERVAKQLLSLFPEALLSKLWQPIILGYRNVEDLLKLELQRALHLCFTHGIVTGATLYALAVFWSPFKTQWVPDIPLILSDVEELDDNRVFYRLYQLLRYFKTIQRSRISVVDIIFRYLLQKPIVVVRGRSDLMEPNIRCHWDVSMDLRGFPRCLYLFVELPISGQRSDSCIAITEKFKEIVREAIHEIRGNLLMVEWGKILRHSADLGDITPYEDITPCQIRLPKELVKEEEEVSINEEFGKVCGVLRNFLTEWMEITYIPSEFVCSSSGLSEGYGGIILIENREQLGKELQGIENADDYLRARAKWCKLLVDRIFGQLGLLEFQMVSSRNALRSAIAAIMARNWAHIFSSQVLVRFREDGKDFTAPNELLDYIITRSEYIADVTGEIPLLWGEGFLECGERMEKTGILEEFRGTLILSKLAEAAGGKFRSISLKVQNLCERIGFPFGAAVGRHAIFAILENYIRNVSKYGVLASNSDPLEIHLGWYAEDDAFITVKLSSNSKIADSKDKYANVAEKIAEYVSRPVIDETGALPPSGWGFKEMKIHACLLAGEDISALLAEGQPHFFQFDKNAAATAGEYTFYFKLRKYKPVLKFESANEVEQFLKDPMKFPLCDFVLLGSVLTGYYNKDTWATFPSRVAIVGERRDESWLTSHVIFLNSVPPNDDDLTARLWEEFWELLRERGAPEYEIVVVDYRKTIRLGNPRTKRENQVDTVAVYHGDDDSTKTAQEISEKRIPFSHQKLMMIWINEVHQKKSEQDSTYVVNDPVVVAKWKALLGAKVLLIDDRLYEQYNKRLSNEAKEQLKLLGVYVIPETEKIDQSLNVGGCDKHLSEFQFLSVHYGYLQENPKTPLCDETNLASFPSFIFMHTARGKIEREFIDKHYWFQKIVSVGSLMSAFNEKFALEIKMRLMAVFLSPQQGGKVL